MHALFFEVRPHPGHLQHYFDHVDRLRPALARHEGLAFLDRYAARGDADLLLSHQLWESEEAIVAWRRDAGHRYAQEAGRHRHFADYRIRVGARVLHWHASGPERRSRVDAPDALPLVVALYGGPEITRPDVNAAQFAAFESVNHSGRFIALADADTAAGAKALYEAHAGKPGLEAAAIYAIRRDYGQFDRTEAPG